VIGSSRVNTMVNPKLLGNKLTNITKAAKHTYYNIAVLDLLSQYKRMPKKAVIFNIEVEDAYYTSEKRMIEDVCYLKYYYGKNTFISETINERGPFEKLKYIFSSYRFNGENFTIITNPLQEICVTYENGFIPLVKGTCDDRRLIKGILEMKKVNFSGQNLSFIKKLKHLKKLCEVNNIELILIHAPYYYIPNYLRKGIFMVKNISNKLHIDFIDFALKYERRFHKKGLWYDHLHLNAEGADVYTKLLKKELTNIKKTYN
jgi:hypothetical protein